MLFLLLLIIRHPSNLTTWRRCCRIASWQQRPLNRCWPYFGTSLGHWWHWSYWAVKKSPNPSDRLFAFLFPFAKTHWGGCGVPDDSPAEVTSSSTCRRRRCRVDVAKPPAAPAHQLIRLGRFRKIMRKEEGKGERPSKLLVLMFSFIYGSQVLWVWKIYQEPKDAWSSFACFFWWPGRLAVRYHHCQAWCHLLRCHMENLKANPNWKKAWRFSTKAFAAGPDPAHRSKMLIYMSFLRLLTVLTHDLCLEDQSVSLKGLRSAGFPHSPKSGESLISSLSKGPKGLNEQLGLLNPKGLVVSKVSVGFSRPKSNGKTSPKQTFFGGLQKP